MTRTVTRLQPHNVGKRPNPTPPFHKTFDDVLCTIDDQRAGIARRGVDRVWEGLLPGIKILERIEGDFVEKVFSGT